MNCSYCQTQFDHSAHTPRLLIFCGHSLCEKCCQQLHINSRIQCPECLSNTFIEQVNFLPKNLALLKMNNTNTSHGYCLKHEKKFQAFCNKEKILICVDCILHDSHRNHEMDSIKNAHIQQQLIFSQSLQSLQQSLSRNQIKYDENLTSQKQYIDQYEATSEQIHQYFEELHEIIERQKESQLLKLKEQYDSNVIKYQDKNRKFVQRVQQLINAIQALKKYHGTGDVEFLSTVGLRQEIVARIGVHVQDAFKVVIPPVHKNAIGEAVVKNVQKNFKSVVLLNSANNNSTGSTPGSKTPQTSIKSKKTSSQHGQQIQQLTKQYQSIQPPSNQNMKPMSKKNSKKDPTPATSTPVTSSMINQKPNTSQPLRVCTNLEDKKSPSLHRPRLSQRQKFELSKNCDISIVEQKQSLFNSFFSNMTSFLTQSKQIYVIGGFDEESSNIMKFNVSNFSWEEVTSLKAPRSKFGCALVDKSIYIIGGKKGKQRVSDIQIWNNGHWKSGNPLRKKRSGFGIISYEHFIYIIGGNDGENILNSTEILNTLTGQWNRADPMHEARDQLAACIGKDQRIYAIGGFGGKNNQSLKSVEAFDMVSQKWSKVPSLNIQRRALAAASLADGIYAIGGFDGIKHLNSVQKYEEGSSEWVQVASLKRGRCTHSALSIFDSQQIIIMGGFDEQALDSVQKYSLISNQWQEIARMPSPRFMHSSVLISQ